MSTSGRNAHVVSAIDQPPGIGKLLPPTLLGIAVPADLSIVGFDDLEMARHIQPALTTLHVPTQTMWQAVADRLIAALAQLPVPATTEVEVELVVRESTGPAPRSAPRWLRAHTRRPFQERGTRRTKRAPARGASVMAAVATMLSTTDASSTKASTPRSCASMWTRNPAACRRSTV